MTRNSCNMTQPLVYIVVLNYGNAPDTIACCESLKQLVYDNFKVVVIDNCSADDSMAVLKQWLTSQDPQRFQLIQTRWNLGFAGGNNEGIRIALKDKDCQYVWLLNNDTVVTPSALTGLVEPFQKDSRVGISGSLVYYFYERDTIQGLCGVYNPILSTSKYSATVSHSLFHKSYPMGASMMISRDFFETIGLLSEDYFLYYEELDLVCRSSGKYKVAYAPQSIIYHKEGATIGGKAKGAVKSKLADYYAMRNRIIFTRKFYKRYLPTVYAGLLLSMLIRLKRRQFDRVWMIAKLLVNPDKFM